jgi:hypothetical protein
MDLPRVTEILKAAGLIDTTYMTDQGRDRGVAVHLSCQFYDEGTLDYSSITPEIEGYLRAYDAWKRDSGIEQIEWIERTLVDPQGRYKGTPDRVLIARPRRLIDLKSGAPMDWHQVQLAAYVSMLPDPYSYERVGVYLHDDGTYRIKLYPKSDYAADLAVFMSALNLHNWKKGKTNGRKQTD